MALSLNPLGKLLVYPSGAVTYPGPIATRAAAPFDGAEWHSDLFGKAGMEVGMGSYLQGPYAARVTVRLSMRTADGVPFYLEYISVCDMDSHVRGEAPIWLAGQIEIDPANDKYAWLNRVQLVGRGMLSMDPICQAYEMAYLTGD